jgi:ABC-type antimicrobial peptide transport system permease subunit
LLLSKGYIRLILLASVVAIPASYCLAGAWLETFEYKVPVSPLYFGAGVAMLLVISFVTISVQSFKAATANPAERLRME